MYYYCCCWCYVSENSPLADHLSAVQVVCWQNAVPVAQQTVTAESHRYSKCPQMTVVYQFHDRSVEHCGESVICPPNSVPNQQQCRSRCHDVQFAVCHFLTLTYLSHIGQSLSRNKVPRSLNVLVSVPEGPWMCALDVSFTVSPLTKSGSREPSAVFNLPNLNPDLDLIQWICPFSVQTRIRIHESSFWHGFTGGTAISQT